MLIRPAAFRPLLTKGLALSGLSLIYLYQKKSSCQVLILGLLSLIETLKRDLEGQKILKGGSLLTYENLTKFLKCQGRKNLLSQSKL